MKAIIIASLCCLLLLAACDNTQETSADEDNMKIIDKNLKKATLAGGCFWCIEAALESLDGVKEVISGYTGGEEKNPSYYDVAYGRTGHYEAVEVYYDPEQITYEELLDFFWQQIDPLDEGGQFVDKGSQYKTAIFYHNDEQKRIAEKSKEKIQEKFDKPVVTKILPAKEFYKAEDYHQDFYKKRTAQYKIYEQGSGRKERLKELHGS